MPYNLKIVKQKRFLAVASATVLLVFIVGVVVAWYAQRELDILRDNGQQKLTLYSKIIENELHRHEYLPLVLATNWDLASFLLNQADPDSKARLNCYLERVSEQTDASALYLMNFEGLTVASSNWRSQDSYVGHNYNFRPYFKKARNGKPGHYFAIGATTKRPGLFLSYPVTSEGKILGAVAVKVSMATLEQAWARQGDEKVFITDDYGVIFASNEPTWKFRTLAPLKTEALERLRQSRKYLGIDLPTLDHELPPWIRIVEDLIRIPLPSPAYYLKQQAPLSGTPWALHVYSSPDPVFSAVGTSLVITLLIGLCILLLLSDVLDHRHHLQERKRYQLKVKETLERSAVERRKIINHTGAGLVIMTPHGEVEFFNPTAEHYFGYVEDELKGQTLSQLLDDAGRKMLEKNLVVPRTEEKDKYQIETVARHKNGSQFPIVLMISEIHLCRGLRLIVTIHDISRLKIAENKLRSALEEQERRVCERTAELSSSNQSLLIEIAERKQAEKVLKDTQSDLIQASKLAALGQMSAGVVHELNQPIAAIRNFTACSKLLLERNHLDQVEENFVRITDLTEHMAEITSQLKIFASKSEGKRKILSVKNALERVLALFDEQIGLGKVPVRFDLPADPLLIEGDCLRLEQVLINLISNALDAMGETERPQLEIGATSGPLGVQLNICDNGSGVAEEHLAQLFDPFFTTKGVGKGLGLGLSISYGIIKEWGGSIKVQNRPAGGAEFVIKLPTIEKRQVNG
ncbi:MAG: hypothetical protein DRH03_09425 [Deltaproteobacteria bacterium]|nr:MAG: hypothetical protein DRH03_09425 [Deltaproteobacteria bacterium]